jgi:hypothetical protein
LPDHVIGGLRFGSRSQKHDLANSSKGFSVFMWIFIVLTGWLGWPGWEAAALADPSDFTAPPTWQGYSEMFDTILATRQQLAVGLSGQLLNPVYGQDHPVPVNTIYSGDTPPQVNAIYGDGQYLRTNRIYSQDQPQNVNSIYGQEQPLSVNSIYGQDQPINVNSIYGEGQYANVAFDPRVFNSPYTNKPAYSYTEDRWGSPYLGAASAF